MLTSGMNFEISTTAADSDDTCAGPERTLFATCTHCGKESIVTKIPIQSCSNLYAKLLSMFPRGVPLDPTIDYIASGNIGKELIEDTRHENAVVNNPDTLVSIFGMPLSDALRLASTTTTFHGYKHDIPSIVYVCIESSLKKDLMSPSLFIKGNRASVNKLIDFFNKDRTVVSGMKEASKKSSEDLTRVLYIYLTRLPHSLVSPPAYKALVQLCMRPSYSAPNLGEYRNFEPIDDDEQKRIQLSRIILKSLPGQQLSLLVYLLDFLSRASDFESMNEWDIAQIANTFCAPIIISSRLSSQEVKDATHVLLWLLEFWDKIEKGIFDYEEAVTPLINEDDTLNVANFSPNSDHSSATSSGGRASSTFSSPKSSEAETSGTSTWPLSPTDDTKQFL